MCLSQKERGDHSASALVTSSCGPCSENSQIICGGRSGNLDITAYDGELFQSNRMPRGLGELSSHNNGPFHH
jgi:hypothetical protein